MKAITEVDHALQEFEALYGVEPRVAILPPRLFRQYAMENAVLESVMPRDVPTGDRGPQFVEVRIVEHARAREIEVY